MHKLKNLRIRTYVRVCFNIRFFFSIAGMLFAHGDYNKHEKKTKYNEVLRGWGNNAKSTKHILRQR